MGRVLLWLSQHPPRVHSDGNKQSKYNTENTGRSALCVREKIERDKEGKKDGEWQKVTRKHR
ncbi:hypothetical protein Tco_1374522, partial [Tanacetum coccineum]